VIEEDVTTPTNTVVHEDGSWIGRTIVTLVVLALLVAGAVWLVRSLSDNTDVDGGDRNTEINVNPDGDTGDGGNTDTTNQDGTTDTTVPSTAP
jgi:hypothetical protein